MNPMSARFHSCLCIAALLCSCDKPPEAGNARSTSQSNPRLPRADQPSREQGGSPHQKLRASLTAAKKVEPTEARDKAFAEVAWSALELSPDIFAKAFEQISTDSESKISLIQTYASQLAQQNPDEALTWAASLGSAKEIATAREQIMLELCGFRSATRRQTPIKTRCR